MQEAETLARKTIEIDPALAKAHTTLGAVLAERGRKAEAIDSWKKAVELDASEFDALYNLTVLLSDAGRLDEARAFARQFVATAPPALHQAAIEQLRSSSDADRCRAAIMWNWGVALSRRHRNFMDVTLHEVLYSS